MHTHLLGLGVAAAFGLAMLPAAASAAVPTTASAVAPSQSNAAADLTALTAYHTYLGALATSANDSAAADSTIVDTVASDCSNALADLSSLSAGQLKKSALTNFGNEVDADLALAYIAPSRAALNKFGGVLSELTWFPKTQSQITTRLITTERALLNMSQSDVCEDANTLDAAPLSEPTTTRKFLTHYNAASRNLKTALTAFQTLLGNFETTSERKLVAQINTLVSQFSSQSSASEQADAATVLSDLGVQS